MSIDIHINCQRCLFQRIAQYYRVDDTILHLQKKKSKSNMRYDKKYHLKVSSRSTHEKIVACKKS